MRIPFTRKQLPYGFYMMSIHILLLASITMAFYYRHELRRQQRLEAEFVRELYESFNVIGTELGVTRKVETIEDIKEFFREVTH